MRRGAKVQVFHDPFSRTLLEGVATVTALEGRVIGEPDLWRCSVRFDGTDEPPVRRLIHYLDELALEVTPPSSDVAQLGLQLVDPEEVSRG